MSSESVVVSLVTAVLQLNAQARELAHRNADLRGPWAEQDDQEHEDVTQALDIAADQLAECPATTLDECRMKARAALDLFCGDGTGHEALLVSVARDLAALPV